MSCSLYRHIQTLASLVSSILFSPFEIKQNYSYHLSFRTVSYNLCFVLIISFTSHSSSGSYQDLTTLKVIQMTFVPFPILLSYYPFLMYLKFDLFFTAHGPRGNEASHSIHIFRMNPSDGSMVLLNITGDTKNVINPAFSCYHPR